MRGWTCRPTPAAASATNGPKRSTRPGKSVIAHPMTDWATMSALGGPDFTAADVDPAVRDFYEHTASWRMEVWSQWNAFFAPGGEVIARLWGRRVEQLAAAGRQHNKNADYWLARGHRFDHLRQELCLATCCLSRCGMVPPIRARVVWAVAAVRL
jgi:hypothetical protein